MRTNVLQFEHILWVQSQPLGFKFFPSDAETSMRVRGTEHGEQTYPGIAHMKVTATGFPVYRLNELLSEMQLKPFMSRSALVLQKQMDTLRHKEAVATQKSAELLRRQTQEPDKNRIDGLDLNGLKEELRSYGLDVAGKQVVLRECRLEKILLDRAAAAGLLAGALAHDG
jgi:hypothetical protein